MIIQDNKSVVKINGALETTQFEIKTDDGKMFHILSNLYSNPLGAVVRELSTNCMDGHKIAGSEELPFDIILPGRMDMSNFITFRDYGPGMPHDVIMSIFTTFGQSTKSDSNTETGCLGLGSKSPLAITDSFTVTSVNNGYKTTYSVSKDEEKKPILAKFGSIETDEDNGLSVTVPLTATHQDNILYEIKEQLKFFKIKPNIYKDDILYNMQWYDMDGYFELTPEIFIKSERYSSKDSKIIQGEIGYEFNPKTLLNSFNIVDNDTFEFLERDGLKISFETSKILKNFFEYYQLNIFMPMGTVTFAPSREELIYDNATCKNIMDQILNSIRLIGNNYKKIYDMVENKYQYVQLKNHSNYNVQKILKLDNTMIKFLINVGFGFEDNFQNSWVMKNGEEASTTLKHLKKFSAFDKVLEMRHMYQTYAGKLQTKNMIQKTKDRWADTGYTVRCERITDYIDKEDYKTVKIIFVGKEEKYNKKHITNYLIASNGGKSSSSEMINIAVVKMMKSDITDELKKEFYELCGLSEDSLVEFPEVLKVSEKLIADGKAPTKVVLSRPKTLRVTKLETLHNKIENWRQEVVRTDEIKNDLVGVYIPTFNNKVQFRDEDDTSSIYLKFPELKGIIDFGNSTTHGMKNLIDFLNNYGTSINMDIKIYAGHEKNFKKTKLVHFEDFIAAIVEKTRYFNAVHALNYTQKTFTSILLSSRSNMEYFITNLKFLMGDEISERRIADEYLKFKTLLEESYKDFKDMFYLDNHPIIQYYDKYNKYKHDAKLENTLSVCGIYNNERMKAVEKTLDIKFELIELEKDFDKLNSTYILGSLSRSRRYSYCYATPYNLLSEFRNDMFEINRTDYIAETAPWLFDSIKKPIVIDDEEECDNAINKHDNFEEELLVAE